MEPLVGLGAEHKACLGSLSLSLSPSPLLTLSLKEKKKRKGKNDDIPHDVAAGDVKEKTG